MNTKYITVILVIGLSTSDSHGMNMARRLWTYCKARPYRTLFAGGATLATPAAASAASDANKSNEGIAANEHDGNQKEKEAQRPNWSHFFFYGFAPNDEGLEPGYVQVSRRNLFSPQSLTVIWKPDVPCGKAAARAVGDHLMTIKQERSSQQEPFSVEEVLQKHKVEGVQIKQCATVDERDKSLKLQVDVDLEKCEVHRDSNWTVAVRCGRGSSTPNISMFYGIAKATLSTARIHMLHPDPRTEFELAHYQIIGKKYGKNQKDCS